ncbi:MAG: AAA family ATPase [Myxococcota bacterium]
MNPAVALTQLEISGFRMYQERPLRANFLSPRKQAASALVIAGTNGSGKTSVLEAILFALGQERLIHLSVAEPDESSEALHELHPRACFPAEAQMKLTLQLERAPGTLFGSMTPCELLLTRTASGRTLSLLSADNPPMLLSQAHLDELPRLFPVQYFSSQRAPALMGVVEPSLPGSHSGKLRERHRLHRLKQQLLNERLLHSFSQTMPRDRQWLEKLTGVWRRLRPFDEAVYLDLMPRDTHDAPQIPPARRPPPQPPSPSP